MSSQNIRKMVVTALLIALGIVFQQLRYVLGDSVITTYIIGSLVNLCLIIAAVLVGVWSGVAVSVVTPLIAFVQGHLPLPQMIPWVIAGNAVLVVLYAFLAMKDKTSLAVQWPRWIVAGVIAALVKYAVIAFGQATVLSSVKGLAFSAALSSAAGLQHVQIITAAIAMILGGLLVPMLPKSIVGKHA